MCDDIEDESGGGGNTIIFLLSHIESCINTFSLNSPHNLWFASICVCVSTLFFFFGHRMIFSILFCLFFLMGFWLYVVITSARPRRDLVTDVTSGDYNNNEKTKIMKVHKYTIYQWINCAFLSEFYHSTVNFNNLLLLISRFIEYMCVYIWLRTYVQYIPMSSTIGMESHCQTFSFSYLYIVRARSLTLYFFLMYIHIYI